MCNRVEKVTTTITREKGSGIISFNYHLTFTSTSLEKLAFYQDISMKTFTEKLRRFDKNVTGKN